MRALPGGATQRIGLAESADALNGRLRAHLALLCGPLRLHTAQLDRGFRSWLHGRGYDARQIKALCAVTPGAAATMLSRRRSPSDFFEQVEYSGRRLAKLNLTPGEIVEALRHFDQLLDPILRHLRPRDAQDFRWALEQLQFCIVLALNDAFYQVREAEARAFYDLARAEAQAVSLKELLERFLETLKQFSRANAGRLVLFPTSAPSEARGAPPGLRRPRYIRRGGDARKWVLDLSLRGRHRSFWSIPLMADGRLAGVLQLAFATEYRWLPRELELLHAATERCLRAAERVRLIEDLARREEQVRLLGEHLMQIEEEERRRISRELHDEAGQSLLCIRLQLELLGKLAPLPLRPRVNEMRELTERTIVEIRRIIAALSPAVLEQLGLAAALRQLASRFRTLYPAKVRLEIARGLRRLSRKTETTAYRLVQECFHNIAKHSKATAVNISLRTTDESLRLQVADNGVGFQTEASPWPDSFGLAGMQERVALLGGRLEIQSRPGHGTTIRVDLPVGAVAKR